MTREEKQRQRLQSQGLDDSEIERRLKSSFGDKYIGTGVNTGSQFENSPDSFVNYVRDTATIANPETQLGVQRALTGANKSTGESFLNTLWDTIRNADIKLPNIKNPFKKKGNPDWQKLGRYLQRDNNG